MKSRPDWPKIVALALETDVKLGAYTKPGARSASLLARSHVDATDLGYVGSERQWREFIHVRAKAACCVKRERPGSGRQGGGPGAGR